MKTTSEMKQEIIDKISKLESKTFLFYIITFVDTLVRTNKGGATL